jgi:hypothetical protein
MLVVVDGVQPYVIASGALATPHLGLQMLLFCTTFGSGLTGPLGHGVSYLLTDTVRTRCSNSVLQ